jgi:uncharacterized protein YecE (DUF72 family)
LRTLAFRRVVIAYFVDPQDLEPGLVIIAGVFYGGQDQESLRHAVEVRHESFLTPGFVTLARDAGVAIVFADSGKYPAIADLTGDVVYARLQDAREEVETGYEVEALDRWADTARAPAAAMALLDRLRSPAA